MYRQHLQPPLALEPTVELADGEANAEASACQPLSRRTVLRQAIGGTLALLGSEVLSGCSFPLGPSAALLDAGPKRQFPPALPHEAVLDERGIFYLAQAQAFLVHLAGDTPFLLAGTVLVHQMTAESWVKDGDGTYWLALSQKCTHLGCKVPFRDDCHSFKCPCHGSHYNVDGTYLDGPAPRSLDRFLVSFQDDHVLLDTSNKNAAVPRPDDQHRLIPPDGTACSA